MNSLSVAKRLAEQFHYSQRYGEQPYMNHLWDVSESIESLSHKYYNEEFYHHLGLVAYLHDILEDTDCTAECLSKDFSEDVVEAVVAISKWPGQSYEDYIAAVKANKIAHVVKIHDTMCNLQQSWRDYDERRIKKYSKQLALLMEK